jgi:hypothetical protein
MLMSWRTWSYFSSITGAKGFLRLSDARTPLPDENKENTEIPPVT